MWTVELCYASHWQCLCCCSGLCSGFVAVGLCSVVCMVAVVVVCLLGEVLSVVAERSFFAAVIRNAACCDVFAGSDDKLLLYTCELDVQEQDSSCTV